MSHRPAVIAACLLCAMPTLSHAADSPFPGIYSVIDPVTGMTQDVLKIEPFINGEFNVFPRFAGERAWAGVLSGKVMGARDRYLEQALFPQDSKVRTLAIADIGYLYRTPGDSYSRDGRSDQSITEDGGVKAGNGRLYPALPAAERKAVLARQKRFLKDINKKLEKLSPATPLQRTQRVAELVEERQTTVTYLEAFSACKAAVRECDKQARAAARAR